ncbi:MULTISPECIES: hypothetical protein [Carnobacterium]|uniref:hypothetical protein n=1 Tax=Carnobacterium TaxID=2747 RepID=UPI00191BA9AE|nr:hypothetical protein [Carnobacterium maltaromaticum]CAD5903094.1 hypothetical protein CMALT394_630016 [Carnobacterium maltaromaticum]
MKEAFWYYIIFQSNLKKADVKKNIILRNEINYFEVEALIKEEFNSVYIVKEIKLIGTVSYF